MAYTLVRVTDAGVVLFDYHLQRLAPSSKSAVVDAFRAFARVGTPGVWALWTEDGRRLRAQSRPGGSRLFDGVPVRVERSPVADHSGPFPKPRSPCPYDAVRENGSVALLTSKDGAEIWEACSAAVVGWDGESLVVPPRNRPRVWSTTEAAIRDHLPVREALLSPTSRSLILVNAVKGTCSLAAPYSMDFPADVRERIDALFTRLTLRPPQAASA